MTGHHPRAADAAGRRAGAAAARRRGGRPRGEVLADEVPRRGRSTPPSASSAPRSGRWRRRASSATCSSSSRPWVHFEPTAGSNTWPRCRRGCRAGRWPSSSATARGFPTTPTRRCRPCARPGSPTSIVDAPAVAGADAARDGGDRADGGPAAARTQRRGLAAPAPRRGAGGAREVRLPLQRAGAGARWCPRSTRLAEESEEVFVSFNNNNRDYPVRNALMMKRLLGPARRRDDVLAPRPVRLR